jgi:DNA polymerase-4
MVEGKAEFARTGHELLAELLPLPQPVRLMGLTLSALEGQERKPVSPPDGQLALL